MTVRRRPAEVRDRLVYILPGKPNIQFTSFSKDISTLRHAVLERLVYVDGRPPPVPRDPTFYSREMRPAYRMIIKHLLEHTSLTQDQFLDSYTGRKRTIYEGAIFNCDNHARIPRRCGNSSPFVKFENLACKTDGEFFGLTPRVIQARSPEYNYRLGVHLKPMEKNIYQAINKMFKSRTVMKGLNAVEVGYQLQRKWLKFSRPVAIGLDAKRFDQHVHIHALKWEHSIYKHLMRHSDCHTRSEFSELLSWQCDNRGVSHLPDGTLKLKLNGVRASGDMNTSTGNVLLMCSMIYCFMRQYGIKYELVNNGDDCVLVFESDWYAQHPNFTPELREWFLSAGFNMQVEAPVYTLEHIEFCQTKPVFDGKRYVAVRGGWKNISKDHHSTKPLTDEISYKRWSTSVGIGGLRMYGNMPILGAHYKSMCFDVPEITNDPLQDSGRKYLGAGMKLSYCTPTLEARVSYWEAYGVIPSDQILFEHNYTPTPFNKPDVVDRFTDSGFLFI